MKGKREMKALIQILAIACVTVGVVYEIYSGAHLGYVLITFGALTFAISTKMERGDLP